MTEPVSADIKQPTKKFDWSTFPSVKVLRLALLGFSAGLPIILIFSTLSLWLREAGVDTSAVTYFSWAALGYSFKFIWAPIVDKLPLPILSRMLGRRRGWLLLAQCFVISSIVFMASVNPIQGLTAMALGAVALGFSSATQDIVIDAYRIECAAAEDQALLSSSYIAGYRIGMIASGAGALYLADFFGSSIETYAYIAWQKTYWVMALVMGVGVLTTLLIPEPKAKETETETETAYPYSANTYIRFFGLFLLSIVMLVLVFRFFPEINTNLEGYAAKLFDFFVAMIKIISALALGVGTGFLGAYLGLANQEMVLESYWLPIKDFFKRYGKLAVWILLLVGFYRVSDIIMGVVANLFYLDLGYSKTEIASVSKVFGVLMTIVGSFIGGFLVLRAGVMRVLLLGAILSAATNLIFMWLANAEPTMQALALVIAVDNLAAGLAVAAFLAWLSSLTSVSFTATQYAIFSSVMTLFPKLLGGYSGTMVTSIGYSNFFLLTATLGLPVVILIVFLQRRLQFSKE
jgi:PAT family beta-lactamase induction signal transducer AmpG